MTRLTPQSRPAPCLELRMDPSASRSGGVQPESLRKRFGKAPRLMTPRHIQSSLLLVRIRRRTTSIQNGCTVG
ncbi:unnamed protein product [Arctogadus glacialis]